MATSRLCSIPNCGKPYAAKGYCRLHYERVQKHGTPYYQLPKGERMAFIEDTAMPFDQGQCLIWPFSFSGEKYKDGGGYPQFSVGRSRKIAAHRYICERVHGLPASPNLEAAHSCGNSRCVNPRHLSWKTPKQNAADKSRHGTHMQGEGHPSSKLNTQEVKAIRALRGILPQERIAALFGISQSYVGEIQRAVKWSHLPDRASP